MTASLAGKSIAILAANGFDENQMTEIQRALTSAKAKTKTVAPENGVVNGWQKDHWGHYFPIDANISEALGSDFDMLVIPGGERAIAKLKTNPHTKRIVNHFLEAGKPIAAIGAGVALLALSGKVGGLTLAAPAELHEELAAAGAIVSEDTQEVCENVLTAQGGEDNAAWVAEALELFAGAESELQAA
ncbi:MAG: DJ-1/PfpI family protein [Alphaproteobacteria bacterium]|nr:DJ-1/PfpI family protein [Alphaproteobacteria bacterium]